MSRKMGIFVYYPHFIFIINGLNAKKYYKTKINSVLIEKKVDFCLYLWYNILRT